MANSTPISCATYGDWIASQEPVYDQLLLEDVRPINSDLIGYYTTAPYEAYSANQHTFDKLNSVYPDVTKPWLLAQGSVNPDGSAVDCTGTPCDPEENKISYGFQRYTYPLQQQSWATDVICWDFEMSRTRAQDHWRQIITRVLRPATITINNNFLTRSAAELADKKKCVTTSAGVTLPDFTFTWDAGGYEFLNTTQTPTGRLTPDVVRSFEMPQYFMGAMKAGKDFYESLELHTDIDSFHYLAKEDPTLKTAWRFGEFEPATKEFYKYGLRGFCGDFMVKCLQEPMRFNKIANGRFQRVLPYVNVATTEGIHSVFNQAYQNAQYQFSYINHRRALTIMPFRGEALNPEMPFMVRDFGGKWTFAMNDLGACNGRPIANYRKNKGKFFADFRLAVKPAYPEWLVLLFHLTDKPCITIVADCNPDPGYPAQDYSSVAAGCPTELIFSLVNVATPYTVAANSITVNGNPLTHGAISGATIALFVADLAAKWTAASQVGTWAVGDGTTYQGTQNDFQITGTIYNTINIPVT